ncbi:MAG: hypothetical protein KIT34_09480 [Cyanobacteria bacterium TGS_CYA1]|nr:hypothetical protein [Cyanobacteria bacterium TGS_CYA1]
MSTPIVENEQSTKTPGSFLEDLAESIENKDSSNFSNPHDSGIWVVTLGVVLPGLLLVSALVTNHLQLALLLLKHPVESLCEFALLLLIPVANLITWNSLVKNDCKKAIQRGLLNGMAIGTSALTFFVSIAAVILRYPTHSLDGTKHAMEVGLIAIIFLLSGFVSIYLARAVRDSRSTQSSRKKAMAYVVSGAILSSLTLCLAEAKPILIRSAEFLAVSELDEDDTWKNRGYQILHFFKPERELTMECANQKSIGISGMFLQIDNVSLRQLYFQITGKPFREDNSLNFATMPDEYLSKHVVGLPVEGLSLHRSELYGRVNASSASSTFYWTYVFKNRTFEGQEVRAEIGLPEGAVVSGMSIWQKNGMAQETVFSPSVKDESANSWIEASHQAPAIVTDLGRDRVLLHCYPVPAQGQLKVALAITAPLKIHTPNDASLCLPHFIDTNFSLKGNHELRIASKDSIKTGLKNIVASKLSNDENVLCGKLSPDDVSANTMALQINSVFANSITAIDYQDNQVNYITQTLTKLPCLAPQSLVVVLDGSCAMTEHLEKIKNALSQLSPGIKTQIMVAQSGVENYRPESLEKALSNLKPSQFSGGQDNLAAVIKASEIAGESKNGAVLWIHGPQPSFNKEIYIVSPYVAKPRFFELALDNGIMESPEYFKQHKEVGPFQAISRNGSPAQDLERFFLRWRPGGHEYRLAFSNSTQRPENRMATAEEQAQLLALYAKNLCQSQLEQGQTRLAINTAVNHKIVSPVSIASSNLKGTDENQQSLSNLVSKENSDAFKIKPQESNASNASAKASDDYYLDSQVAAAPVLQGTTNGTIGPQGSDCTMGVNTAGTVRVNNLANLEALLNVFSLSIEAIAILWGSITIASCHARFKSTNIDKFWFGSMSKMARINCGIIVILAGMSMPGLVNFLVASARDANLFS